GFLCDDSCSAARRSLAAAIRVPAWCLNSYASRVGTRPQRTERPKLAFEGVTYRLSSTIHACHEDYSNSSEIQSCTRVARAGCGRRLDSPLARGDGIHPRRNRNFCPHQRTAIQSVRRQTLEMLGATAMAQGPRALLGPYQARSPGA